MKGLLITLEGPDGSGKTTLMRELIAALRDRLICDVIATREPGGDPLAEKIRDIILDPNHTALDPKAEALLYAASRSQHLAETICPALEAGKVVLCDRFVDSSIAYQGYGRSLGADGIQAINQFATGGLEPDLTLYLDLEAVEGIRRIETMRQDETNRLDNEAISFHQRVVSGYQALVSQHPQRIIPIDATKSPKACLHDALIALYERFPAYFKSADDLGEESHD